MMALARAECFAGAEKPLRSECDANCTVMVDGLPRSGKSMIPTSVFGGLVLLTSLAAPEADQSQKRDEVRIELLGCITRNFLSLEGATTPETLRGESHRCRPQLPACSTVNQCDAAQIAKAAPPAVRLRSTSCLVREKWLRQATYPVSVAFCGAENMAIYYGCAEGWEILHRKGGTSPQEPQDAPRPHWSPGAVNAAWGRA